MTFKGKHSKIYIQSFISNPNLYTQVITFLNQTTSGSPSSDPSAPDLVPSLNENIKPKMKSLFAFCSAALGADDLTRPGLVLGAWVQVGDHHVDSLDLLVLGRDGANLVRDLVPLHRHILPLDVRDVDEDVLSSMSRTYESMTLRPGEVFTHPFKYWT